MKRLLLVLGLTGGAFGAQPPTVAAQQKELLAYEKLWAGKLGVTIPATFAVKSEIDMIKKHVEITGKEPTGILYGLSWPSNPEGTEVTVWIMRIQDYPEYADARKAHRDQKDSVVHELIHLLYHTYGEEGVALNLADVMIKGHIERDPTK